MSEASLKVLAFTGSMRKGSYNRRLLLIACDRLKQRGADITEIELRTMDIPMFSLDLESEIKAGDRPMPRGVRDLQELMLSHPAFLIASPEHNATMTSALKNAIDWASRRADDKGGLACFRGKVAGLLAASPGRLGGIRGLPELRRVLSGIGTHVIPTEYACPAATDALGGESDDGSRSEQAVGGARRVADALYDAATALARS